MVDFRLAEGVAWPIFRPMKLQIEDRNQTIIDADALLICQDKIEANEDGSHELVLIFHGGVSANLVFDTQKERDEAHGHISFMTGAR